MADYVSPVREVNGPSDRVYAHLSDWNGLSVLADRLPADKVSDFFCDTDSCRFRVSPVGEVALRIVDREPGKTIKIESEQSPVPFTLWVQIKEKDAVSCYLRLTLRGEIPFFLKAMVEKPLREGLDKASEALASLSY